MFSYGCATLKNEKAKFHTRDMSVIFGKKDGLIATKIPDTIFDPYFERRQFGTAEFIEMSNKVLLVIDYTESDLNQNVTGYTDTLQFIDHQVASYSGEADSKSFSKLTFAANGCYGSCPAFEFTLSADGKGNFNGLAFTKRGKGGKVSLDKDGLKHINDLLNNMRFTTLDSDYGVDWSDDTTITTAVNFEDGSTKVVSDYGGIGTLHLTILYDYLRLLLKQYF